MAKIEGFRIKNYRVLQDVTLGKLWNMQQAKPLTPMTAVIGKNGVGKSALFCRYLDLVKNSSVKKYDLIAVCDQQILKERILEPLDWVSPISKKR